MALTVYPTHIDEEIAREVASHTDRRIERGAETLTWGADEHVLVALATLGWLLTQNAALEPISWRARLPRPYCHTS
jgi:hypothetical protein